jgi:2-oxoglutarate ferredoxin oxidoreductase subunit delta
MANILIDKELCKGCLLCAAFCPKGLISPGKKLNKKGYRPAEFEGEDKCLGCALCAIICPDVCIEVYK